MAYDDKSGRIRNYAMSVFFIMITITVVIFLLQIFVIGVYRPDPITIRSECKNESVFIFIGAGQDLKDIRCIALDNGFFSEPEITIGDLSKNGEDVCKFRLLRNATEPLRFEVRYDGNVRREVCNWQYYYGYVD